MAKAQKKIIIPPLSTPDQVWVGQVADRLALAERSRQPVPTLEKESPWDGAWPLSAAYAVQDELRRRHVHGGERLVGHKVAITTRSKLQAFGLASPIAGYLRASGLLHDGGVCDTSTLSRPRIEPELAFVLRRPLQGPGCSVADVMAATECVACAFEIIDSRYEAGPFHLFSAVADNVSTARHVIGPASRRLEELDLGCMGTVLRRNGEIVATGASGQVLGHPAVAVAELVNSLAERGMLLEAGALVLTGGIIDAIPVSAGDCISARFQGLGELSIRFS